MSALNAALCKSGIILWLVILLASRSTHSAPVYDQDTTQVAEYDGVAAGCYFNFQRYQEGDRIITSEPCLNCTCHNRMLMCYLKVCPFTKAIGQDCKVEKRPDQCCPVITCPEVPVQLLTSTTSASTTSDSTEVGFHDNYGCNVDDRFYPDGAQLPVDHHNPCELCYCIRNRTTCVMQECTLRVAGCKPVYQPGVCCPIRYNCEYDEEPSTTVSPTPGLIVTTTLPPGIIPQCYYKGKVYEDGKLIYSIQPCQHCYCFRGEIACAVQNCGTPMEEHGKNCTAVPPPEGKCCPTMYKCEEDGQSGIITLPENEEQLPEQTPHDLQITEFPMLIDQEQQVTDEQKEFFPGADNAIPHDHEGEEEEELGGTIEHITKGPVSSTEKSEEETATPSIDENAIPITKTTAAEESTLSYEHVTETSPIEEASEQAVTTELPAEKETTKTEILTTVQEIGGLASEEPATELPKVASTTEGLQTEEGMITTEHIPAEHADTEENVIEIEHSTLEEKEKPTQEPSIRDEIESATKLGPVEETSPHQEFPAQIPEEVTKPEVEQVSVTEISQKPEISTEIVEEATSSIKETEQPSITTILEFVTEVTKEGEDNVQGPLETISNETLATETESPIEEATATIAHEVSSTEQIVTEKEEISHPIETAVTEEIQPTEVSSLPEEQPVEKEYRPTLGETKKEQELEVTSEHTITEEYVTVSAKKEDAGQTESTGMSEEPSTTKEGEEQHTEKSIPEIPSQGPTGIPIPERMPEQKAEDQYHFTEDYHDITHPEIVIPDNLVTEIPQKIPTTHFPQEQETTLFPSEEKEKLPAEENTEAPAEETVKPIVDKSTETPIEEITKPISEETTEINLTTQKEISINEISTESEETKAETTPAIAHSSTDLPVTTTVHEHALKEETEETEKPNVSEEIETEIPQTEIQSTEQTPSNEESSTKGLTIEEPEGSFEEIGDKDFGKKELQPKKEEPSEEEAETQPPIAIEPEIIAETSTTPPTKHEYSTVPLNIGEEQATEGTQITTTIPSDEQITHIPQAEEKETVEEEKPISQKPVEEYTTEEPITVSSITVKQEEESHTDESFLKEKQTTETITETEEKLTTQVPTVEKEEIEPEQHSTEKAPEEAIMTEGPVLQETEAPIKEKPIETEEIEQKTEIAITEVTTEAKPTEGVQTELPITKYSTEKVEEESEEKISVPMSTEEIQTEVSVIKTESTQAPTVETETKEIQTEPSGSKELPTQPSITDRKEDQGIIEPTQPSEEEQEKEEQITQKPYIEEKEITETYEGSQEPTISYESEKTHTVSSEETTTESILPEDKLTESSTTKDFIGISEAISTQPTIYEEQTEITSKQSEEITTEPSKQKEQTQESVTHVQPELHVRKETESPSSVIHEESYVTPTSAISEGSTIEGGVSVSESTEVTTSEGVTKPVSISEISTEPALVEEHTEKEDKVPIEKETVTESVPSKEGQEEIHEHITQPTVTEEQLSQEIGEISTEEPAIPETPEMPITEEQIPEGEEMKEMKPELPTQEQKEHIAAPEEIPELETTTEVPLKEVPPHSTEYPTNVPEETFKEEESVSEIAPRPSGIPGEGNCLVEGQSYSNNSVVPPANSCQTSCRCISSIVQCELVQCPAPPTHLSNCMPVYTNGDVCCPMYACDSTPTAELESGSHMIEPHAPEIEKEKGQKTIPPAEISTEEAVTEVTEAVKEVSTVAEISTPESTSIEVTIPSVSQPEEETGLTEIEETQTTVKSIEPVYEQPTTIGQPIEHPEEHTVSSVPETSEEVISQIPEKEEEYTEPHVLEETTEGKVSEEGEGLIKSVTSTEQPQEESVEEQTKVSEQITTSTHTPVEKELHGAEEESSTSPHKEEEVTVPIVVEEEKEISIPVEIEKISTSTEETEKVITIAAGGEETTISTKEQEKPTKEEGVEQQFTLKPIEEIGEKQLEEKKVHPITEEPFSGTTKEHEISTKLEEVTVMTEQPVKSEVSEEEKTIEPTEYESTSIPEIRPTSEHKPEEEVKHEEEEQETITSTESEEITQTEEAEHKPEGEIKLSTIAPSEMETQEPVVPAIESTTLVHDHTISEEEAPLEEHSTIKSVEISTEENKGETEPEISSETPIIEEHVTIPVLPVEVEIPGGATTEKELEIAGEEIVKPTEKSVPEFTHESTSPESVGPIESTMEIETTKYVEKHTEVPITEHEKESSVTQLPEEKPLEPVSPGFSTEQPTEITEVEGITEIEAEHEKPTESSTVREPESTQVSVEEHPSVTPELPVEFHTTELPVKEYSITAEVPTSVSVQEEAGEQYVTPIVKDVSEPSLSEAETETVSETGSETPTAGEEHITVSIEEQTPKYEKPIEEQTIASPVPSKGETPESSISMEETTLESVTSQEEKATEKTVETTKPVTQLPDLTEERTVIPEVEKEVEEEQEKPEVSITEETSKEEPVTEMEKEKTTEEAVKEETGITEEHPSVEEHTEQKEIISSETEPGVTVSTPVESEATIPQEQEEKDQGTSEASLPEHPVSGEATTTTSLVSEEYPSTSTETEEKIVTQEPEYQTPYIVEEEVTTTEVSETEKPPSGIQSSTEKPEELITEVQGSTEKPEEPITEVQGSTEKPEELVTEVQGSTEKPEELITQVQSSTEKPEELITEIQGSTEKPEAPITEVQGSTEKPEELITEVQGSTEKPEEPITEVQGSTEKPEELVTEVQGSTEKPEEFVTEVKSLTEKPEEFITEVQSSTEKPEELITEVQSSTEKPEELITEVQSSTEKPEEFITKVPVKVSSTEQSEEILPETEKPAKPEQQTESPEQTEITTKAVESVVTEETLPEKVTSGILEIEEKSTETPSAIGKEEEETHSTTPISSTETSTIHEEPIIKLQPTESSLPSEEETSTSEEPQPSPPEEGEKIHPDVLEEPQSTEHALEITEQYPEIEQTSEVVPIEEYPLKASNVSTEEEITIEPISSEEPKFEIPVSTEESLQSTEPSIEEHVTKTQSIPTELTIVETTEEIPEEGEEIIHPHTDHFPEATVKPEIDHSVEGQLTLGSDEEHLRPVNHTIETTEQPYQPSLHDLSATTLTSHIPEYSDQSVSGEDNPYFPMHGGTYLNPDEDYDEDDQAVYGPGTCRYGGKVYVSAQQIPRDDPCDFCFCFRSDIICLQQSCPPPIPGCHEEPISGFCCPRYECPVSMTTALNLTTTTTTTTTTLPPHFHAHAYKGAARRSGCHIHGQAYRVGEVIKSASGPCLHCTCGGDGNMKCEPRVCSPEPMLRQMIAAATAKRRR